MKIAVTEMAKLCLKLLPMVNVKKWYAVYTKPRWEKKVNQMLLTKGIETYCPLNKVRRKWSDRIKLVSEPLFKSYVFVKIAEEEKAVVRMTDGVLNFVYWMAKPAIIKSTEIERIKKFMNEYEEVEVRTLQLVPNAKVLIKSGALMDKEAIVKRVLRKKVEVMIDSLGYKLIAYVEKRKIAIVK